MMLTLPPVFTVTFEEFEENKKKFVRLSCAGQPIGDVLDDNAYQEDGYRFHDAFHFSFYTHCGHSDVVDIMLGNAHEKAMAESDTIVTTENGAQHAFSSLMRFEEKRDRFEEYASVLVMGKHNRDFLFNEAGEPTRVLYRNLNMFEESLGLKPMDETLWRDIIVEAKENAALLERHGGGILVCDTLQKSVTFQELTL